MRSSLSFRRFAAVALVAWPAAGETFAQSTEATLQSDVFDEQRANLPGARAAIENVETEGPHSSFVQERVTSAASPIVEAADGSISTTISRQQLDSLRLAGRVFPAPASSGMRLNAAVQISSFSTPRARGTPSRHAQLKRI